MNNIAIKGRFSLRYKTYLGDKKAGMKDIEIVEWTSYKIDDKYTCWTIASFDEKGQLVSCGDRLLDALYDGRDISHIRHLATIAREIIESDDEVDPTTWKER